MSTTTTDDELVDWRAPGALLRLNHQAFWKAVHTHGIPHYRINARKILFKMSEVRRWLESRRVGAI